MEVSSYQSRANHMKHRTCVVTINYRNSVDTAACVASVRKSDGPTGTIVVVDNSPNDRALAAVMTPFADIKVLRPQENLGFGRGCNLGISWALCNTECEFVFLLNNDAVVKPDAISLMEGIMDEKRNVGAVTPRIVFADDPDKLCYGRGRIDWRRGGAKVPGFGGSAMTERALLACHVGFASGCAMLLRREVLEVVKGFDEVFFMYEEDVDLSLRIVKSGYRIFYCPESVVLHRVHGSQRAAGSKFQGRWSADNPGYQFQIYHSVKNSVINARKHARGRGLLMFVTIYPLFLLWRSTAASRKLGLHAFSPVIRGLRDGLGQSLDVSG